jgi:TonB family protein
MEAAMVTRSSVQLTRTALAIAIVWLVPQHAYSQPAAITTTVEAAGPLERRAVPITQANPIPRRTMTVAAPYPREVPDHSIAGTVTLRLTLDTIGQVAEARQAFRPDPSIMPNSDGTVTAAPALAAPFVTAALDAVRGWQYEPPAQAPISFYVRLQFLPDRPSTVIWQDTRAPLTLNLVTTGAPRLVDNVIVGGATTPSSAPAPIRVGGQVTAPRKLKDVTPIYPPDALKAGVQGIVIIEATIGTNGAVEDAHVLRSIPQLDQAALDAVRQWEFSPTLINGEPAAIIMSVTVNFQLARQSGAPDGTTAPGTGQRP